MTVDQQLNIVGILVSVVIALITYRISNSLSAKNKYDHEVYITNQLSNIRKGKVILANVKKYNSDNNDTRNETYYKQACGFDHIIPVYGVVVFLRDSNDFKAGLIPFDWIEYVRPYDSEDGSAILVCKFKGIKWYKNFKSAIKKILDESYSRTS